MFIVHSGFSPHMVNNMKLFPSFKNINTEIGVAKKDEAMKAEGKGSL